LKGYLENWEKEEYIPEQYRFDYTSKKSTDKEVNEFLNGLDEGLEADGIHQAVFEFAKGNNIPPKEIFKKLYLALIGKEKGPRIGKLIYSLGVKRIKEDLL